MNALTQMQEDPLAKKLANVIAKCEKQTRPLRLPDYIVFDKSCNILDNKYMVRSGFLPGELGCIFI